MMSARDSALSKLSECVCKRSLVELFPRTGDEGSGTATPPTGTLGRARRFP